MKEALYYRKEKDCQTGCRLCPHHCVLKPGQSGICRVRTNREGTLFSLNYARIASLGIDPIEKKPLYHFHPGGLILSAGTFGCNLACPFCQNYAIAHQEPDTKVLTPQQLADMSRYYQAQGSMGVAFTYNEPAIWFEYVLECARLLQQQGQKIALVSNGYIESEPLAELLPLVGAMNIDVKSFRDDFYRRWCKGSLDAVKERVAQAAAATHVEVTTLVIPGENDSLQEIEELAAWLAGIDPTIPLHLSRYHPAYRFERPATPELTLRKAKERAQRHLQFVYLGNLGGEANQTHCISCGNLLIDRTGYRTEIAGIDHRRQCRQCGSDLPYLVLDDQAVQKSGEQGFQ